MLKVLIKPSKLSGKLKAMPSKSVSHRMVICAALAGNSRISNVGRSQDIDATTRALEALGFCGLNFSGDTLITGKPSRIQTDRNVDCGKPCCNETNRIIDCGESGSTLRFLIPLAMDGRKSIFTGQGRLLQRTMKPYADLCREKGIAWEHDDDKIVIEGQLKSGEFVLPGDVSSQFVSGLLFALPSLFGDSVIKLQNDVESRSYIDLTLNAMKKFSVEAHWVDQRTIFIAGDQKWKPAAAEVEGDYSHAAFFLAAGALGGEIELSGLQQHSLQGDRAIIEILTKMGANLIQNENAVKIDNADHNEVCHARLRGIEIDASQIPDLVPILSVVGALAQGNTKILNASRLRDKESDRLSAMASELQNLGAAVEELPDGLNITGGTLRGGSCDAHGDHRVAMSLAIAAAFADEETILTGAQSVSKSAPDFWNEYAEIGGNYEIL